MQFRIDNASDRPVYQQIMDQIKRDIALGRLIKNERLPEDWPQWMRRFKDY